MTTPIEAALQRGDIAQAAALADAAVAGGAQDVLLLQLAALHREEAGDFAAAHARLAAALRLAPGEPALLVAIAAVWRRAGDPRQGLAILDAMIARGLDHAPTWAERGHALVAVNDHRAAHADYLRAIAADPGLAAAHAGAADTAIRIGEPARAHAEQALACDPANLVALNALATIALEAGDFAEARARLDTALARTPPHEPGLIETHTLLGDAWHGLADPARAFAAYGTAQALYRRLNAPRFGDERRGQHALIAHVRAQLDALDPAGWRPLDPATARGPARGHLFLMGYPRSGTTLVENALASLPEVVALEEKPLLAATEAPLLTDLPRLATLGQDEADAFRAAYWQGVADHGVDVQDRVFVDMNPLRGISLPIVARLFPEARLVVMRRDPRDVVWSCFRRHFAPTPTGYAFSDLESTARHYDAVMALMEESFVRLSLAPHVLRYDDLVRDFDGTTQALCTFAGLDWRPEMRGFARTADIRGVTTASVRQVRKGLFDGTGQWRRYEAQLAPVLPILQPWVERFGFAD